MRLPGLFLLSASTLLGSLLAPAAARAQELSADLALGFSSSAFTQALSGRVTFDLPLGIELGTGLRLNHFAGDDREFRNVGDGDPAVFPDQELSPNVWGLNVLVSAEICIIGPLSVGFNLDLLGFAFGPDRTVDIGTAEPAAFSAFLIGENDRGSLDSEFFLAFEIVPEFQVRAGASHFVNGYEVTSGDETSRYQRFYTVPFVGVRFTP